MKHVGYPGFPVQSGPREGLERIEPLGYQEPALREAILNAITHKDYASTWAFLKVYDDKLELWNPGPLPEELTIEKLKGRHSSYPLTLISQKYSLKPDISGPGAGAPPI